MLHATAGNGTIISLTGFWSGNDACVAIHWHVPLLQTGNSLSLRPTCTEPGQVCGLQGLTAEGQAALGGNQFVDVVSATGTVNGNSISFTITTDNGLTFTFNGAFSQTGTSNPYITGTVSGPTLPAVGINWERQAP